MHIISIKRSFLKGNSFKPFETEFRMVGIQSETVSFLFFYFLKRFHKLAVRI